MCILGTIKTQKTKRLRVANTPQSCYQLLDRITRQGVEDAHVCLEATNMYHDLVAQILYEHGMHECP